MHVVDHESALRQAAFGVDTVFMPLRRVGEE
jgi:hypothetical protein